jgi:hypothetical protein
MLYFVLQRQHPNLKPYSPNEAGLFRIFGSKADWYFYQFML